jgi:hypothetical protein
VAERRCGVTALADQRTLIAVGAGGTVLHSEDAGESWEARPSGTGQILMGVTALGITAYLKNGARWRRPRRWRPTTARARQFYDRRREELNLDEVERIRL